MPRMTTLCIACMLFVMAAQAQQVVTGTVIDRSGKPLNNVEVWGDSLVLSDVRHPHPYAFSDEQGRFRIVAPGSVMRIHDWTLRPASVVVGPETHEVILRTEPANVDALKLPYCKGPATSASKYAGWGGNRKGKTGWYAKLQTPRRANTKWSIDSDYAVQTIYFGRTNEKLRFARGPRYGGYDPPPEWLSGASSFTERAVLNPEGHSIGIDVRGTLKTGETFRSFGLGTDYLTYVTMSPDARDYFDAFIGTACLPNLTLD